MVVEFAVLIPDSFKALEFQDLTSSSRESLDVSFQMLV